MLPNLKGTKKASFGGGDLQAYLNMVTWVKEAGKDTDSQYVLLTEEPSNWETNFNDYFEKDGDNYVPVSGVTAPTWKENTYYEKTSK